MDEKLAQTSTLLFAQLDLLKEVTTVTCWEFYQNNTVKIYTGERTVPVEWVARIRSYEWVKLEYIIYEIILDNRTYFVVKSNTEKQAFDHFPKQFSLKILAGQNQHIQLTTPT